MNPYLTLRLLEKKNDQQFYRYCRNRFYLIALIQLLLQFSRSQNINFFKINF
jgi:hypothetical protein